MERILRHHFPHLSLDVDALREYCDTLLPERDTVDQGDTVDQDGTRVELPEAIPSAPASDGPGLEDENCTLDYVDGTTVRT
jgi:hypothetical protein